MARKPNDTVQLNLRFSEDLRRRLEREAARSGRSMNAEIIQRVEQTFHQAEREAEMSKYVELAAKTAATTTMNAMGQRWFTKPKAEREAEMSKYVELAAKTAATTTIDTLGQRWLPDTNPKDRS
jgi:type III secretory pathway component EscV